MRDISLKWDVEYLKGIIKYAKEGKISREEMYKNYYGYNYKDFMAKGTLDKYLKED